jgi:hypothetical protein
MLLGGAPFISYFGRQVRAGGIAEYQDVLGERIAYTSTCSHCQRITEASTARELRDRTNICRGCMKLICIPCGNKPCFPWEKNCEHQEREYLKRRIEQAGWGCY